MLKLYNGEQIILKTRRHWFAFFKDSFGLVLALLFPFFLFLVSFLNENAESFVAENFGAALFFSASWILVLWCIFFIILTNYYLDIFIVTNYRVIDIEQHGLFARDIVEMRVENIQDTKIEVLGVLASLLDFGNLHIQTAGETKEIVIFYIAHPYKVKEAVSGVYHKVKILGNKN